MKKTALISFLLLAAPLVASADGTDLPSLISKAGSIINSLIPVLIALALVAFFWGLVRYIWSGGEEHEEGKNIMIAGLVGLFIMVSIWGIIRIAQNTLGVNSGGTITPPHVGS